MKLWCGIGTNRPQSCAEIGRELGISGQYVWQLNDNARRRLSDAERECQSDPLEYLLTRKDEETPEGKKKLERLQRLLASA